MDEQPSIPPQQPIQTPPPTQPPAQSAPPAQPPVLPKKSKRWLIILIVAVVFIVAVGVVLALVLSSNNTDKKSVASSATKASRKSSSDSSENGPSGILAGQQQYARDSKRQADILSIQTQLEAYFQEDGYYPSFSEMSSPTWRNANMQSMDPYALVDPKSSCDPAKQGCLVATPQAGAYAYAATDSTGKSCEADATKCAAYTLTATLEGIRDGSKTISKQNLD